MSLRWTVGFLLTRRFSPRVIPRTAPARSFHSLVNLPPLFHSDLQLQAPPLMFLILIDPEGSPHRRWPSWCTGAAAGVAAAAFAGAGALAAVHYFRKVPDDDDQATRKKGEDMNIYIYKEEEMKERFENWMKRFNKTYRNEKEKAMRFQVFKETMKWIESQPPSSQKSLLPGSCFADLRSEGLPCSQSCIGDLDDPDTEDYRENKFVKENVKGEAIVWKSVWKPATKQGNKQATQGSA